jgi:hypothetical protein
MFSVAMGVSVNLSKNFKSAATLQFSNILFLQNFARSIFYVIYEHRK